jgi:hypothetical protein
VQSIGSDQSSRIEDELGTSAGHIGEKGVRFPYMWHGIPRIADAALKSEMNLGRTTLVQVRSDSGRKDLFANRRQGEEVRFLALSPADLPIGSPKNEAGLFTE